MMDSSSFKSVVMVWVFVSRHMESRNFCQSQNCVQRRRRVSVLVEGSDSGRELPA